jgi:hypothetical protein
MRLQTTSMSLPRRNLIMWPSGGVDSLLQSVPVPLSLERILDGSRMPFAAAAISGILPYEWVGKSRALVLL